MTTLYRHQTDAVERAKNGNLALFHECGTGKTLTALKIIEHHREQGHTPALVVCPLSIIQSAWIEDCRKFTPQLSIVSLWDKSPAVRKRQLDKKADIYVANFETFKTMFAEIQNKGFPLIIVDESSKMKAFDSQITKALLALAGVWSSGKRNQFPVKNIIPGRYILSGTPAPNSRMEYWPQMTFVSPNTAFSDNFYGFRGRYFVPRPLGRTGINLWDFTKDPNLQTEFNQKMSPLCHVVRKADAVDLPAMVTEIRKVKLSAPERRAYDQFRDQLALTFGSEEVLASSAVVEIMKARQLTSGFCYGQILRPGSGQASVHQTGKSKLNELKELLQEIGNKQVIIWCCFVHEIGEVLRLLPDAAALYGGTKDREKVISDFQTGKCRYLVANPQSAGHGLTFVNCSYAIYFSMDYSWEMNKQSQDRIHRIGQNHKCTCYYLLAEESIDEVVYEAVQNKKKLSEEILKYLRQGHKKAVNSE